MNLTRRSFLKAGALAAAGLAAPALPAAAQDAPGPLAGFPGRGAAHRLGPGAGPADRGQPGVVRRALWGRALGGPALAAAPGPRPLGRPPGLHRPRAHGPAAVQRDVRRHRGLPPAGHLRPRRRGRPAGGGLFPRRGQPHRRHPGAERPPPGRAGGLRRRLGGVPAGAAGLQRPARSPQRPGLHRQLRPAGRRQGPGLGPGEHRCLWRRRPQRHGHGLFGGGPGRAGHAGQPLLCGAVPEGSLPLRGAVHGRSRGRCPADRPGPRPPWRWRTGSSPPRTRRRPGC